MKALLFIVVGAALCIHSAAAQEGRALSADTAACIRWSDLGHRYGGDNFAVIDKVLYGATMCDRSSDHQVCVMKITELEIPITGLICDYARFDTSLGVIFRSWSEQGEYRFNFRDMTPVKFEAAGIISQFLAFPIASARGWQNSYGCVVRPPDTVTHPVATRQVESVAPLLKDEVRPAEQYFTERREANGIGLDDLRDVLRRVNIDPIRIPHLDEFGISDEDLARYADSVAADIARLSDLDINAANRYHYYGARPFGPLPDRSDIYRELPDLIDTIGPEVVGPALALRSAVSMRLSSSDRVILVNEVGETLICEFETHGYRHVPFNLPWTIHYQGQSFLTFDPDLARMLMALLPESDEGTLSEESRDLLYAIAWYLAEQRMKDQAE